MYLGTFSLKRRFWSKRMEFESDLKYRTLQKWIYMRSFQGIIYVKPNTLGIMDNSIFWLMKSLRCKIRIELVALKRSALY